MKKPYEGHIGDLTAHQIMKSHDYLHPNTGRRTGGH
jgi:hypothetical protein